MSVWGTGLLKGLRNTMRNMMRGPITEMYPYEKWELPERARWALASKYDEDGAPKCTACMNCVRACPDGVLTLESTTAEDKTKTIDRYVWEMGACMFCGLCVESCPFDAIEMSHEYELAVTSADALWRTLLEGVPAAKPKRAEKPAESAARPAAGEASDAKTESAAETAPETPKEGDADV
jgi:NADH-quinone oxidoreductase subunit I